LLNIPDGANSGIYARSPELKSDSPQKKISQIEIPGDLMPPYHNVTARHEADDGLRSLVLLNIETFTIPMYVMTVAAFSKRIITIHTGYEYPPSAARPIQHQTTATNTRGITQSLMTIWGGMTSF
jgi:hypothetical protein